MAETTHTAWRRERFREQRDPFFSIFFCSIRRPYITFKLPRIDKDTPLRLCNLPDLRRLGCVTSAHLEWPVWSSSSGNNCHAVHRSLSSGASLKWDLHLVPYYQPSTPARFLLIIGHWDVSHPLFQNCRCDHHRAEITIMQFIGQSLPAHHFFYGTVRIFTLSHIVSQAVFYIACCWCVLSTSMWCIDTVLKQRLLWINTVLFYRINIYIYIYSITVSTDSLDSIPVSHGSR